MKASVSQVGGSLRKMATMIEFAEKIGKNKQIVKELEIRKHKLINLTHEVMRHSKLTDMDSQNFLLIHCMATLPSEMDQGYYSADLNKCIDKLWEQAVVSNKELKKAITSLELMVREAKQKVEEELAARSVSLLKMVNRLSELASGDGSSERAEAVKQATEAEFRRMLAEQRVDKILEEKKERERGVRQDDDQDDQDDQDDREDREDRDDREDSEDVDEG